MMVVSLLAATTFAVGGGPLVPAESLDTVSEACLARYNGAANGGDRGVDIAVDGVDNVYVTGRVWNGTDYDFLTVKYDTNCNELWARTYNGMGSGDDQASAIAVDGSGNAYVTGQSWGGTSYDYDYLTIKYDTDGNLMWPRVYNGTASGYDTATAIAVDGSGKAYVTGSSVGSGTNTDYVTIKYDTNGNPQWVKRYNGPGNVGDGASGIAVDGAGNVFVTGHSWGSGTEYDFTTVKYDTAGEQRCFDRYNGPGNHYDIAYDIAVDDLGNVYATGLTEGSDHFYDYLTIKYDNNCNRLWPRTYDGPTNWSDTATGIAVDGARNVYVTGFSDGLIIWDYATIKYDTNGNAVWLQRYHGGSVDRADDIAVDAAGNSYVTGYCRTIEDIPDYCTVKYDNTTSGDEQWVARYDGPANLDDVALAVAVDGAGDVWVTGGSTGTGTSEDSVTIKYMEASPTPTSTPTATPTATPTSTPGPAVGGVAEFPSLEPEAAADGLGPSEATSIVLVGAAVVCALLLAAGAWYGRRYWLR